MSEFNVEDCKLDVKTVVNRKIPYASVYVFICSVAQGPSENKDYLSQIQFYSIFSKLPVLSSTVVIITVCVKVAYSTFLVTNKSTKWAELSRYYLCNCFVW